MQAKIARSPSGASYVRSFDRLTSAPPEALPRRLPIPWTRTPTPVVAEGPDGEIELVWANLVD